MFFLLAYSVRLLTWQACANGYLVTKKYIVTESKLLATNVKKIKFAPKVRNNQLVKSGEFSFLSFPEYTELNEPHIILIWCTYPINIVLAVNALGLSRLGFLNFHNQNMEFFLLADFISEPYGLFLLLFISAPPIVAALLIVKPLRKILDGVLLVSVVVPLIVTSVALIFAICALLSSDIFFKLKSVEKLLFGSEFSRFQDDFHNVPFDNLEEQFGPFSYYGLMENPCFLDRYSEETLGTATNVLLGGVQKIACYAEWKSTDDQNSQLAKLIKKTLNENILLIRNDLFLESLDELSLLEIPKITTTRTDEHCYATAKYNVETLFQGKPIGISITDYYDFTKINPNEIIMFWDRTELQGRSCNSHCFTRQFNIDFSKLTTQLDFYEFAKQYFDQHAEKKDILSDDPDVVRAHELTASVLKRQHKELADSYSFQQWLYSTDKLSEERLSKMLRKAERDFVTISKLEQRSWANSSDWSHPYLFETKGLGWNVSSQWESPTRGSSFSLKDDNILFLFENKSLMDEIAKNCTAKKTHPRFLDWPSILPLLN
jgi:hypothetical protein